MVVPDFCPIFLVLMRWDVGQTGFVTPKLRGYREVETMSQKKCSIVGGLT